MAQSHREFINSVQPALSQPCTPGNSKSAPSLDRPESILLSTHDFAAAGARKHGQAPGFSLCCTGQAHSHDFHFPAEKEGL